MTINKNFIFCAMKNIHCRKSSTLKCIVVQIKKTPQTALHGLFLKFPKFLKIKITSFLNILKILKKLHANAPSKIRYW